MVLLQQVTSVWCCLCSISVGLENNSSFPCLQSGVAKTLLEAWALTDVLQVLWDERNAEVLCF